MNMATSPITPAPRPTGGGMMAQADAGPAGAAAGPGAGGAPQGQPLTAEQQQGYDLIVKQALGFLLDDNHARLLVQKAQSGDPRQVIADAVGPLLQQIYGAAKQAGANVDMVTLLAAGINVITVLAQMLSVAGIIQEADIPKFCKGVAEMAITQHNSTVQQQGQGGQGAAPQPGFGMVAGAAPEGGV